MRNEVTPTEHTYVRAGLRSWWDHLPLLLVAGLTFVALWTPTFVFLWFDSPVPAIVIGTITIVPAWVALLAQASDAVRDVKTSIMVMLKAVPRYWGRSAGLGLLFLVPAFGALLVLPAMALDPMPTAALIGLAGAGLGALMLGSLFLYALPLLVLHDQRAVTALRNALVLSGRYMINTLGLMSMLVLFALGTLYVSPLLLLFWPPIFSVFVVNNCRMVIAQEMDQHHEVGSD